MKTFNIHTFNFSMFSNFFISSPRLSGVMPSWARISGDCCINWEKICSWLWVSKWLNGISKEAVDSGYIKSRQESGMPPRGHKVCLLGWKVYGSCSSKILFNIVGQPSGELHYLSLWCNSVGQHMELVNCFDSNVVMGKLVWTNIADKFLPTWMWSTFKT